MATPVEMVKAAMDAGMSEPSEGLPWIKENYDGFEMRGQVFGRMKKFITDRKSKRRTRPKKGKSKKRQAATIPSLVTQERKWQAAREQYVQKKIHLAKTVKELLKDHLPTEIEEMVSIVAATS